MTKKAVRTEMRRRSVGQGWILAQPTKFFFVIVFLFGALSNASAEISSPPMIIVGTLSTESGLEVTSGFLQFEFIPEEGTPSLKVNAEVGTFKKDMNFHLKVHMETIPLTPGTEGRRLGAGVTYTPQVTYEGEPIADVHMESPFVAIPGAVIGPLDYTVSPQGAAFSVSEDLEFGKVDVGASTPLEFQINNVGTENVVGVAHLLEVVHFAIEDASAVNGQVTFELIPGESKTVQVRFSPVFLSDSLTDIFRVETAIGDVDRSVSGYSAGPTHTPTPVPTATATPTMDFDQNDDTKVDAQDLIFFLGAVKSGGSEDTVLFSFSQYWMRK